jgi:alpha-galactosidase
LQQQNWALTMTKISFIGAGSLKFTFQLVRDILTFPLLEDSDICLMDRDADRLDFSRQMVEKIIVAGNYPAKLTTTLSREEALDGADVVLCTILSGGVDTWRYDIEIPKKYGVDINVGDTRGPSGIFRFLRTLPQMQEIIRDMETLCPDAVMLNYTNPMAMLCGALQRISSIRVVGLCHSVQITAKMLARWIGAPIDEISYTCAGINHLAWFLDFKWKGVDAYPLINEMVRKSPEIYKEEIVRNEMFLALGYYVTESSGHNSEYNWWFRKRPDLIKKYCTDGSGWNPGEYAFILKEYLETEKTWKEKEKAQLEKKLEAKDLQRGFEYAASIINSLKGGEPFLFNGNVPNKGFVSNLPVGACVEVPVLVDQVGFHPVDVGSLPLQCAMLTNLNSCIEEMAIHAALEGDPVKIFQAIAHDPLTASVLSLAEIREMTNEMFEQNHEYLTQFIHTKV